MLVLGYSATSSIVIATQKVEDGAKPRPKTETVCAYTSVWANTAQRRAFQNVGTEAYGHYSESADKVSPAQSEAQQNDG